LAASTPAINEGCTRPLRLSHTSRRAPLQPVPKTQVPCIPYHPPDRTGVEVPERRARGPVNTARQDIHCVSLYSLYGLSQWITYTRRIQDIHCVSSYSVYGLSQWITYTRRIQDIHCVSSYSLYGLSQWITLPSADTVRGASCNSLCSRSSALSAYPHCPVRLNT
jgi:hypothetical protein